MTQTKNSGGFHLRSAVEREKVWKKTQERESERERESKRVVIECHKLRAAESLATTHDID